MADNLLLLDLHYGDNDDDDDDDDEEEEEEEEEDFGGGDDDNDDDDDGGDDDDDDDDDDESIDNDDDITCNFAITYLSLCILFSAAHVFHEDFVFREDTWQPFEEGKELDHSQQRLMTHTLIQGL